MFLARDRSVELASLTVLHAVRGVSFSLRSGRTLGLVGESGSGKTKAAMAAIRLVTAHAGTVLFDGIDLRL